MVDMIIMVQAETPVRPAITAKLKAQLQEVALAWGRRHSSDLSESEELNSAGVI